MKRKRTLGHSVPVTILEKGQVTKSDHDIVAWSAQTWAKRAHNKSNGQVHHYYGWNGVIVSRRKVWRCSYGNRASTDGQATIAYTSHTRSTWTTHERPIPNIGEEIREETHSIPLAHGNCFGYSASKVHFDSQTRWRIKPPANASCVQYKEVEERQKKIKRHIKVESEGPERKGQYWWQWNLDKKIKFDTKCDKVMNWWPCLTLWVTHTSVG